jgi:hypothetical protein
VPTGWTARPRVQDGPMITLVPAVGEARVAEYALPECEHVRSDEVASNAQKPL